MLAPDDLNAILDTLKEAYVQIRHADQLVSMGGSFRVYDIGEGATWVASLRTRVGLLAQDAGTWLDHKPGVVSTSFSGFLRYQNAFSAAATVLQGDSSKETKVQALEHLRVTAQDCMDRARRAKTLFEDWGSQATTHLGDVDESIQDAWSNLGSAEKKVVTLAEKIVAAQDALAQMEGVIAPDQLSSNTISNLTKVLTNSASLVYSVAFAGLPMPYMTVATTFFTLDKLFVDIFATEKKVHQQLQELVNYRLELDEAQLALAQTKAALSSLYDLKLLLSSQSSSLDQVETFWRDELRNLTTVRDKFALATVISPDDPELRQLPVARAAWDELKTNAQGLLSNLGQGVDSKTVISITT